MAETNQPESEESDHQEEQRPPLPLFQRGMFWMIVGVIIASGGVLWLYVDRYAYTPTHKPAGFYVAIAGFVVYVCARVTQVLQQRRKSEKKN